MRTLNSSRRLLDPSALCGIEGWILPRGIQLLATASEAVFLQTPYQSPVVDAWNSTPRPPACGPAVSVTPAAPPLFTSSYPGREAMAPVEVQFDTAVTRISVYGVGAFKCWTNQYGTMTALDSAGRVVGVTKMEMREPGDCGDDSITYGAYGTVATASPLIRRLVIQPPQPWSWDVWIENEFYGPGYVTADYMLVLSAEPASAADVIELTMPEGDSMPPSGTRVTNIAPFERVAEVRVRTAAGGPVAGRAVNLRVVADSLTAGGHSHRQAPSFLDRRPTGTFRVAGTMSPTATVVTEADGRGRATYVASVVGGTEVIWATAAGADSAQRRLILAVPKIVSVPDTSVHYFMEPTRNHSPGHNYAHAGVIAKLDSLLSRYKALHVADPARYPFDGANGRRFRVTAVGLPRGGLYDVNGQWTPVPDGHNWHREGLEVDVNDRGNGQGAESVNGRSEMLRLCRSDELALQSRPRKCIYHFGHFHITYPGMFP